MQYKIPVQIENEDPIFLGLGLKQLAIIMIGGAISFSIFNSLKDTSPELAAIPSLLIFLFTILVAIFKHSEMTFIPFILSLIRTSINGKERYWMQGIDSFQPIDIGYVKNFDNKKTNKITFESKREKLRNLENKINKI